MNKQAIVTSQLRLREKPGTNTKILFILPLGAVVDVIDEAPTVKQGYTWQKIKWSQFIGYVANIYIKPYMAPPLPNPQPTPNGWHFPFNASIRGIHGNAGGWLPDQADLEKISQNKIELLFIVPYERNQAAVTIQRMRDHGVKHFVLRAVWPSNFEADAFIAGSLTLLKEYANVLGTENLMIQLHNEPNLIAEGCKTAWQDGADFAAWWLQVATAYREVLPGCKVGFPALSPGNAIQGVRVDEKQFAQQARAAIKASDFVALHYYWQNVNGDDINPPMSLWRSLYGNKPFIATEVGAINSTLNTPQALNKAHSAFNAIGVPMCAWLLSSPYGFELQSFVKQNIIL